MDLRNDSENDRINDPDQRIENRIPSAVLEALFQANVKLKTLQTTPKLERVEPPTEAVTSTRRPPFKMLFIVCILLGRTIAMPQLPQTWRTAISDQERRGATIGFMSRLNAPLRCLRTLELGLLAAPVVITTAVDLLLLHGLQNLIGV